jgi:phosphoglucosamine mutase
MYETPVGDKYVIEKLRELPIVGGYSGKFGLGGEQAGHIIILNDEFTTGDGIRTALFTLRAFIESGAESFIDFASKISKTPQIIASAYLGEGPRFDQDELNEMEKSELEKTSALSRVNLRYSGTEPVFRTMIESNHDLNELELARISMNLCKKAQLKSGKKDGYIDILNCTQGGMIEL